MLNRISVGLVLFLLSTTVITLLSIKIIKNEMNYTECSLSNIHNISKNNDIYNIVLQVECPLNYYIKVESKARNNVTEDIYNRFSTINTSFDKYQNIYVYEFNWINIVVTSIISIILIYSLICIIRRCERN